jgi:hypothetical protein
LINDDALLVAIQNADGFLESLIAVGPSILDYAFLELIQVTHVGIHCYQVDEQLLWLEVESLWVLDLEL